MKLNIDSAAMYVKNSAHNKAGSNSEMRKNMVCNYCKKKEHIKAECYRLNGFPENFKSTNSRKSTVNVTIGDETNTKDLHDGNAEITSKDYNQLVSFLKQCKIVDPASTSGQNEGSGNAFTEAVHGFATCAGPSHQEVLGTW